MYNCFLDGFDLYSEIQCKPAAEDEDKDWLWVLVLMLRSLHRGIERVIRWFRQPALGVLSGDAGQEGFVLQP